MIDLKAIRAAAEAATKGEWKAIEKYDADPNEGTHFIMCKGVLGYWRGGRSYHTDDTWVMDKEDATHIATANPAAILELLDRLEAVEKALAEPAPVPLLSDDEIVYIRSSAYYENTTQGVIKFARAIEQLVRKKAGL